VNVDAPGRKATVLLPLLLFLALLLPAVQADGPVVRAVLFWSKTCPRCHVVLDQVLPPLQEEYGDQLQVLTIEVSPDSYELWLRAVEAFQLPPERRGVPLLFIGDTVLVGSREIPDRLPGLIEQHLAAGGVDYPAIPGLVVEPTHTPTRPASATPRPTPTIKACHICDEDVVVQVGTLTPTPTPVLPTPTPTPGPRVHFWLFWDSHCGACLTLIEDILPSILEEFEAGQVVAHQVDLEKGGYELMRALEAQHGLEYGDVPEIFIGDQVLLGNDEIQARLGPLIEGYLAEGGVALPEVSTPASVSPTADQRPSIHLAYFYQPGCRECDRVQLDLNYLQHRYPQLIVHAFDVKEEAALAEWLGQRAGVAEEKRLTAPAVFVGDAVLVDPDLHTRSLEALVQKYAATGSPPTWNDFDPAAGEQSVVERFKSLGIFTVAFAGLIDGLNPCAFATLIFFVSYLAIGRRKGKQVLAVGSAFTAGVFLAYLMVGLGFHHVLGLLGSLLTVLGRWLYGLTAALCAVLAVVSLLDFRKARRGELGDMALNLPHGLRMRINAIIRRGRKARAFVAVAFVTGIAVSFLELACTGQVYLPTIIFVMSVPAMRARAVSFLLLYNILFITPLLVVFILVWYGTAAKQLTGFLQRHAASVKLGMALLFTGLAVWLVTTLI